MSDEYVVARVLAGESALYELLIRRHNQRIYRAALAILRNDAEAEDVMQEAYVRAYEHLADFEGRSAFSTWLTRIAVHEAFRRLHRNRKFESVDQNQNYLEEREPVAMTAIAGNPEQQSADREASELLERAIFSLPRDYRVVLIMRDIEEMSTAETAAALEITEESVKVRLHRARVRLRHELYRHTGASKASAFQFHASRCDRVTNAVLIRIGVRRINPSGAA